MTFRRTGSRITARRQLRPAAQRTGCVSLFFRIDRIRRNLIDRPWRASGIACAVAIGVAIAIAIIAASNGIDVKINSLLGVNGPGHADRLRQEGINISDIQSVLRDTSGLLTRLSIGFTAALVGLVTWVTTSQRRRDIGIDRMRGAHTESVIGEMVGESFFLCIIGGLVGVGAGLLLCYLLGQAVPLLPLKPTAQEVVVIFPMTTFAAFAITAVIAAIFAKKATVDMG